MLVKLTPGFMKLQNDMKASCSILMKFLRLKGILQKGQAYFWIQENVFPIKIKRNSNCQVSLNLKTFLISLEMKH